MAHFCYTYASSLIIATNTFYHAGSKDHSGLKESSCEQHRIFISVGILSENMHEPLKWVTEVSVIKALLRGVWGRVKRTNKVWGSHFTGTW